MKISNKAKMIACFVLAVLEAMLVIINFDAGNTQAATMNIVMTIFLLYGGFQFRVGGRK